MNTGYERVDIENVRENIVMIKTVIFDMGGVIITLNHDEAVRRFSALGLQKADEVLNPYCQAGIFGDLEEGKLSLEEYQEALEKMVGRKLSFEEVRHCWLGYAADVPANKLAALRKLKEEGYRVILLSNTNPYMSSWTDSTEFSGDGHAIGEYFDALYRSYEVKLMKPDDRFFRYVLTQEKILPEDALFVDDGPRNCAAASELGIRTYCPQNGADWTEEIYKFLK